MVRKIKVIRSWASKANLFLIGQDDKGNLVAKCNRCNVQAIGRTDFDRLNHILVKSFICPECKCKLIL